MNEYPRSVVMKCCLRYIRYIDIHITPTPKTQLLYLLQILKVTAYDKTCFSPYLLKMQRKFSIYCLANTINIAQFIFQTLLRLLLLISVFWVGCSEQNKLHNWWTNPFWFSSRPRKLQPGPVLHQTHLSYETIVLYHPEYLN